MNNLIDLAGHIPTPEATLTVAYTPIRLPMPGRQHLDARWNRTSSPDQVRFQLLDEGKQR